jgi:hypothetical protein
MSTPPNKTQPPRKGLGEPQLVKLKLTGEYRRYFDWWRRYRQLAKAEDRGRPAPKVLIERKALYKAAGARLPNGGHLPGFPPGVDAEHGGWLPNEHGHVAPDVDLMAPMWAESFEGYLAFLLGAAQDHGTDIKQRVLIAADVMGWADDRVRNMSRACLWAHRIGWAHTRGGGDTGFVARWAMAKLHAHYHAHGYDLAPYRGQMEPRIAQPWAPVQVEEHRTPMVQGIDRRAWEPRRITMRLARRLAAERLIAAPPPGEEMDPDDLPALTEQGADYAGLPKGVTPEGKLEPTPAAGGASTTPSGEGDEDEGDGGHGAQGRGDSDDGGEDEDEADDDSDSEDERDDDSSEGDDGEDEDTDDDDTASRAARRNVELLRAGRITPQEAVAKAQKRLKAAQKRSDGNAVTLTKRELDEIERLAEQTIEAEFPGLGARLEKERAKAEQGQRQSPVQGDEQDDGADGAQPPGDGEAQAPKKKRGGPPPARPKLDVEGPWAVVDATRDALITVRMILLTYRKMLRNGQITIRTSDIKWLIPLHNQLNADLRRIMTGGDAEAQQIATGASEPLPESVNVKAARASGGDVFAAMADDAKELYHIATLLKQQSATDHYQRGHTTIGKLPGHGAPKPGGPA